MSPTVRLLSDGPQEAIRDALVGLSSGPGALASVAASGIVEALALAGLRHDETRVVESQADALKLRTFTDSDGARLVLFGPLVAVAELPNRLREWGAAGEAPADAISRALQSRGAALQRWEVGGVLVGDGRSPVSIGPGPGADIEIASVRRVSPGALPGERRPAGVVLVEIGVTDGPDRDGVVGAIAAQIGSLVDRGIGTDATAGFSVTGPPWLLPRLGQLRPLGVALAWDCGSDSAGAAAAQSVLAAQSGIAGVISEHPAVVHEAVSAWAAIA